MTLSSLASLVCSKVRKTDAESVAACKSFLTQRHEMIYHAALWRDCVGVVQDSLARDPDLNVWQREHHCDPTVERVLGLRWRTGTDLVPESLGTWMMGNPTTFEDLGEPASFTEIDASGVSWNILTPGTGAPLTITSSDARDVGAQISIDGESGYLQSTAEQVALTGGSLVTATGWYSVRAISKPVTFGWITIESPDGQMRMQPHETVTRCVRLRLAKVPAMNAEDPFSDQPTLLIFAKRKLSSFVRDADAPMMRGADNALIALALGDMLERERQYAKAQAKTQEGQAMLQLMLEQEKNQSAGTSRLIPVMETTSGGVEDFGW